MRLIRIPCLVLAAFVAFGLVAIASPVFAQACGQESDELKKINQDIADMQRHILEETAKQTARQAFEDAQERHGEEESLRHLQESMDAELKKRIHEEYKKYPPCPKIEVKPAYVHSVSLSGVGFVVVTDKDFSDFYGGGPLKSQSFFAQPSGASPGQGTSDSFIRQATLALVGEAGFTHADGATLMSFQGGVRVRLALRANPKLAPFAQVLAGVEHCSACQYTTFAFQPGFGVLYGVTPRVGIVAQLDFRIVPSSENEMVVSGGVTFALAK
jgi:hypothetical protein